MRTHKTGLLALFTLLLFMNSRGSLAQAVANAEIHGTVQDSSGAGVSGAQVKATQTDTGYVQTTVSSAEGLYSLPNLLWDPIRSTLRRRHSRATPSPESSCR